ncbi:iron-siderophore ABC transporter substrate-binding protein [Prauserella cavernicola]|uniref:Iron-siderophore ABC transporter substrate-binding protein n=1 Tax=Prauserella cavernicola TaxID=2800127 RepID=A0A934V7H3_9PSEU|nr:iron-siderophore ABC transporter substrate-binding protein [Prauserella cavernicola]MBK1787704.1 iron-siderophore ABC transporter substrate-binding protein [Prauserella cavernicola]
MVALLSSRRARRTGLGALALATMLLASACGGSEQSESDSASGNASDGAFPVTIEHKYGSTTIEERPERVVAVGLTDQDALLALDVVPVASTKWLVTDYPGAVGPWAEDKLGDAETPVVLDDSNGLQFERIAEQQPDLIVGLYAGMSQEDYDTLSQLAPTIAQPEQHADFGIPWQEQTRTVGKAVGKADQADQLVDDVEGRIESVKQEHPEFAEASGLLATTYDGYFVFGSQDPRSRLLSALGFTLPEELDQVIGNQFGANVSRERADLLDTDVLIWFVGDGGEQLEKDPLYNRLRVAKEGRDLRIDESSDYGNAFSFASALSIPYLLDELVPQLEAAIDGDPATTP